MKYAIEVYENYAMIRGSVPSKMLTAIIKLCKEEGLTHITNDNYGFKLIRDDKNLK